MAVVAISFTIAWDSSEDYSKRYSAIVSKIKSYSTAPNTWDHTTSFYLMETNHSATTIAAGVYTLSEFRSSKEEVLAINLSNKTDHQYYGALNDTAKLDRLLKAR